MAFLEIQHYTGDVERRPLSKQSSLTIGSHASCDLRVDEEAVEILHCRISWGKQGYEAVAAGVEPIEVNGTAVRKASLKLGDVLRFGTVDIRYREGEDDGAAPAAAAGEEMLGLKPITDEVPPRSAAAPPRQEARKPAEPPAKKKAKAAAEEDLDPDAFLSALDALANESAVETSGSSSRRQKSMPGSARPRTAPAAEVPAARLAPAALQAPPAAPAPPPPPTDGMSDRVRQAMRTRGGARPGEEDVLRSPLVLGLTGGAVVLTLAVAIFYFIGYRQTTQQKFDAAKADFDAGNYIVAIEALQEFLIAHPRDPLDDDARRLIGSAKVRQQISGAAPKYQEGLKQLRELIEQERDQEAFEQLHGELVEHSRTIAHGAAIAAGRLNDPALLDVSDQAKVMMLAYTPKNAPPTVTLEQIEAAYHASKAAILRDDIFRDHLLRIESSLKEDQPLRALQIRRELLVRYPQFATDRKVADAMARTLKLEVSLCRSVELPLAPAHTDHSWPEQSLTLAFQGRTRTDELAVGQAVMTLAGDSAWGVEFVTGQPLWRRAVGADAPFFPLVDSRNGSFVLWDGAHQELVRLEQKSGKLLWRLPLGENVSGQPLLTSDAVYVSTAGGKLLAVDLETGALTGAIAFSQPVSGPVELEGDQRLVVAGREEVVYTLTKRPFAVENVFDLGQGPDSIRAPLMAMASYLLLLENRDQRSTAHLLKVAEGTQSLESGANAAVPGRVLDAPVIRGRDLFIPFLNEGVASFALSDDAGQPPLGTGPVFVGKGNHRGPAFLLTGPERQVWAATGGLARLRLTTDSLQPEGDVTAIGYASQPLQSISGYLFHARRRLYSRGVTLTRTDRETLVSDWQAVLASPLLALTGRTGNGSLNLAAVNDGGQVFRVGERQFSGGFLTDTTARLPLHPDLADPLLGSRVHNDRLAVACGGPEPRVWVINAAGQIESSPTLPAVPQAAAVSVDNEIIVPLAGRAHVLRQASRAAVQEYLLPTGQPATWMNIVPAGGKQALGVLREGTIIALRLNDSPRPNLGETTRVELGAAVRFPAVAAEGLFAVADATNRVAVFESERLEPRGARDFPGGVSGPPRIAAGKVFVDEGHTTLHCLDPQQSLPRLWNLPLENAAVCDVVLHNGKLLVGLSRGEVLTVDAATGEVTGRFPTASDISSGPFVIGDSAFVATVDATLVRVP